MCLGKKSPFSFGWEQQDARKPWIYFTWVHLGLFPPNPPLMVYFFVHRKQREFWWSQPYQPHTHLKSTIRECADTSSPVCASWGSLALLSPGGWLPAQERISDCPHCPNKLLAAI